jgi:hypothetical protein
MNEQIIIGIIQTIVFLLPITGVIYKLSRYMFKVDEMERDLSGYGMRLNSINDRINGTIESLREELFAVKQSVTEIAVMLREMKDRK